MGAGKEDLNQDSGDYGVDSRVKHQLEAAGGHN